MLTQCTRTFGMTLSASPINPWTRDSPVLSADEGPDEIHPRIDAKYSASNPDSLRTLTSPFPVKPIQGVLYTYVLISCTVESYVAVRCSRMRGATVTRGRACRSMLHECLKILRRFR